MKKLIMMAAAAVAAFGAWAATETVGDYTWTYRISGDTAEIYNNYSAAISPNPTGAVTIPATLGGKPVTSIGDSAFSWCSGLTSVTIPDSVTSIGDSAFSWCSGLTSVTIPDSVTSIGSSAFSGCSGLTSVTIPDSVTSIGEYAFVGCSDSLFDTTTIPGVKLVNGWAIGYTDSLSGALNLVGVRGIGGSAFSYCSGLTSVTIGNGVTSIGTEAFYGCSGLTSITIPDSVTSIGWGAFCECEYLTSVTIGNGVTSIGGSAFSDCRGLTSVTIPDSVTSIGSSAFEGCSDSLFDTTTIPGVKLVNGWAIGYTDSLSGALNLAGVRGIGGSAFYDCSGLTSVTIGNGVTSIGTEAFSWCRGLTSVTIPSSVTSIGWGAFWGCSGLTSVTIPDSVTVIMDCAFSGCSELINIVLPPHLKLLGFTPEGADGGGAFDGCSALRAIEIPDSVTSIGDYAFRDCSGLTSVTIPDGVTSIGDWAFEECSGLTSVTIGNGVTSIGEYAFSWCSGLTSVTFLGGAPEVGEDAFYDVNPDCVVYVKPGSTGWGVEIPGTWNGLRIEYIPEPEPVSPTPAEPETVEPTPVVPELWPEATGGAVQGTVPVDAASSFDGFLSDAAGNAAGTVLVKVAKPKNGAAKATVTIQPVGGRKVVVNGKLDVATGRVSGIDLTLGADGMSGTWNGYAISGSRNLFASKDKTEQGAANGALNAWKGAVNVAWEGAKGWNGLTVSIAAKGKAKVAGTLAGGAKVTAGGQLVVGEEWCCVPVVAAKAKLAFAIWLPLARGAAPVVAGLGPGAVVGRAGSLVPGAAFRIDAEAAASAFGGAMARYLPDGVAVAQGGARWTVAGGAKAGKVAMKNGVVDDSGAGANPSALKLSYTAKSGAFKGSFKAYAVANGKLKATIVNVAGVMIGGKGYGAASVKKRGGVPVTVE